MDKLVSIVIPCYNDGNFIEFTVQSILEQTYSNKEIIVIDDGSKMETKKVLKKLENKIDQLITQENSGPSVARNNGITAAKGEYILTLDADDYFEPTFLAEAVKILNNDPAIGLVTCYAHLFDQKGNRGEIIPKGGDAKDILIRNGALASSLFRKISWSEVQGYDQNMVKGYEDWDFNISITKAGWKIYVIKEHYFHYRLKEKSRNNVADSSYKYDLLTYIYLKHKDVFFENYEENILNLFSKIQNLEMEKQKIKKTFTYKFGYGVLRPLKFILKRFNNNYRFGGKRDQ